MFVKCRLRMFVVVFLGFVILMTGYVGFNDHQVFALDNGVGKTPPMGWNSWNHFRCHDIDEQAIKETADAMVENGMKDAGYEYIVVDDCWQAFSRDENGNLQGNPDRFPSGIKALVDYVHERGLKFGIYAAPGSETCAMYWDNYPAKEIGSFGHEKQDAKQFAKWGIDYLKYDWCRADETNDLELSTAFKKMRDALEETGRPILYSIHPEPEGEAWTPIANMWRTTSDINDSWSSVMTILDQQVGLYKYAGPGHWNDPDMLEVGNGGMTSTEYRAHFSLWSILSAPLLAGNDLRDMSDTTKEILTNKEVIAIDQDAAGVQGHKIKDDGDHEVWMKPLENGDRAVVLLNRGADKATMSVDAKKLGLKPASTYVFRDLWSHKETTLSNKIDASVPSHGVAMFRVSRGELKAEDIQSLVTDYRKEGKLNQETAHTLQVHLSAVAHYEKHQSTNKIVKHMKGFKKLILRQKQKGQMTDQVHKALKDDANQMINQWL